MATIKYINDDIDSDVLNLKLAENYLSYLDSRTFDKNKWAEAYKNVMNAGITGISADGGRYSLQHNGFAFDDPDGYYGDVADYIINIAQGINEANKAKIKEEEEKKKNLIPYSFDGSPEGFTNYILSNLYGGNEKIFRERWNELDEADLYGLRGTTKRRAELARQLELYRDQLDGSKFSFEGTPFEDINDLKKRINEAITELKNPNDNDYSALRALGINDSLWLDTNKENADKARAQALEQLKAKQAELLLKLQAQKANQYKNFRFFKVDRFNGTPPQGEDALKKLNSYYNLPKLNTQQWSELIGAFKYAGRYNMLENLSREELSKFGSTYSNNPTRLKKIRGLNGFYLDTVGNRIILPFMGEAPKETLQDIINLNSPEALKEKARELEQSRKIFDSDLTTADIADIGAALTDTLGVGTTFIPVIGNAVGATTGLVGSLGHFVADVLRDGLDWGDAGKLALNAGFDLATLLPGLGTAAKAGKVAKALAPWLPRIIGAVGIWLGVSNGGEIVNSFKKLSDPTSVTVQDLLNISQGIALLAGGINITKGEIKLHQIKKGTPGKEATVTTQNGQEVKLNEAEYNTITSKNATREAKNQALLTAALRLGISLQNDGLIYKGRSIRHPLRTTDKSTDVALIKAPVQGSPSSINIGQIRQKDKQWLAKHRWAASLLPGKTLDSKLKWTNNGIYTRGWEESVNNGPSLLKPQQKTSENVEESKLISVDSNKGESPYARKPLELKKVEVKESDLGLSPKPISYNRETMLRYNDAINERFGNTLLSSGNVKIGDNNFLVVKLADGTYSIFYKGENIGNERNQIEILKIASNFVKNLNKKDSPFGKVSAEEMGKLLREFKAKGWLKHGGRLDKLKIQIYKNLIK